MENIYFSSREGLIRINISSIVYFESNGNFTNVVTTNKLHSYLGLTLGKMEEALAAQLGDDAKTFIRVGKRFIINSKFIYRIDVTKQQLVLSDFSRFAFQLPISKDALRKLKDYMITIKK